MIDRQTDRQLYIYIYIYIYIIIIINNNVLNIIIIMYLCNINKYDKCDKHVC